MFRRTKNPKTASRNTKHPFVSARRAAFVTFVRTNRSSRTKTTNSASRNTKPSFVSARRAAFVTFVRPNHSRLPVVYEPSSDLNSVSPTISIAFTIYASGTAIGNICAPDADLSAFHPLFPSFTETEYLPAA